MNSESDKKVLSPEELKKIERAIQAAKEAQIHTDLMKEEPSSVDSEDYLDRTQMMEPMTFQKRLLFRLRATFNRKK